MFLVGGILRLYEQLAAHAEVAQQRAGRIVQRHPEVFAAPHGRTEAGTAQPGREVHTAREMATDGTRVQHLDV